MAWRLGDVLHGVAAWLSTPLGLAFQVSTWAVWLVLPTAVFNVYVSLATMFIGGVILVSQRRGDEALHAKLDEMIRSSNARDEYRGLDHRTEREIERARADV